MASVMNEARVTPTKFDFDTPFGDQARDREQQELAELRRRVESAREEGRAKGHAAGRAEALAGIEAEISATLARLVASASALFEMRGELARRQAAETATLAHAIASRLAPALMAHYPLAEVEALVSDCLASTRREPRLVLRLPEALMDGVHERLEALKAANGFTGDIVLLADPALGPGDGRIEWPDGGAERDMASVGESIAQAIERFCETMDDAHDSGGPTRPADQA